LEQQTVCALLRLKYQMCVERGIPDYNVRERDIL